jgi:hypothetical protein
MKINYLYSLGSVRENNLNLNSFLNFALKGITLQAGRVTKEINNRLSKAVFRNLMYDLFGRLESPRKRVIAKRQIEILNLLLEKETMEFKQILNLINMPLYSKMKNPANAILRDLSGLLKLDSIEYDNVKRLFSIKLEWPQKITRSDFMEKIKELPKSKTYSFLTKL